MASCPLDVDLVLSWFYLAVIGAGHCDTVIGLCAVVAAPVPPDLYPGCISHELSDELYLSVPEAIPHLVLWDSVLFLLHVCPDLADTLGCINVFAHLVGDAKVTSRIWWHTGRVFFR